MDAQALEQITAIADPIERARAISRAIAAEQRMVTELARLRRARALEYFVEALASDVADVQGGTTAEGIHLGAMAGTVDVLQRCFAGVETRGDTLRLDPYWPPSLGTLQLRVRYRELPLDLRISGETVRVTAGIGRQAAVRLCCRGQVAVVGPGEALTLPAV